MNTYNLKALQTCLLMAKDEIKEVTIRPKEEWLLFNVQKVEIYQTGIYLRGQYKREEEERLLKRVEWHPRIREVDREIVDLLNKHHKKGLILLPSQVLNCII